MCCCNSSMTVTHRLDILPWSFYLFCIVFVELIMVLNPSLFLSYCFKMLMFHMYQQVSLIWHKVQTPMRKLFRSLIYGGKVVQKHFQQPSAHILSFQTQQPSQNLLWTLWKVVRYRNWWQNTSCFNFIRDFDSCLNKYWCEFQISPHSPWGVSVSVGGWLYLM